MPGGHGFNHLVKAEGFCVNPGGGGIPVVGVAVAVGVAVVGGGGNCGFKPIR